jgi:hypothetical protein
MSGKEAAKETEERNKHVVDWTVSVVGIFWGVWWAFFVGHILDSPVDDLPVGAFRLPKWGALVLSVLVVLYFVIRIVQWMWYVRSHWRGTTVEEVWDGLQPVILCTFLLCALVAAGTLGFKIELDQMAYGLALTIVWPLSILGQVFLS